MKLSEQWLREWANPAINTQQLANQLTMAGLEIESIAPVAGEFNDVIIGHITDIAQHPDADRLRVCQVNIGQAEPLNIVCGGANARTDLKVAVAIIGAKLPNGLVIKAAKLRGVPSQGMLCSTSELGLTETSDGIMELPADAPIGKDLREWLQLNDYSLDIHLTPNRGDCLSIRGTAREIAVLNQIALTEPNISTISATISDEFPIHIQATEACPRYCGRVIRNINASAKTPLWMQERLRRSGLRSIHPVVDVTNYVLLELGQPLHAFDLAKLDQNIVVRHATANEQITLLDDQTVTLTPDTLVIADQTQVQAIAGVMGGLASSVIENTQDIFLESAFFEPLAIAGRARRYGLNTDSAYRFERGVDPALPRQAIERATELLLTIVGGNVGPVIKKTSESHLPRTVKILLRKPRIAKILGITLADDVIENILQRLGMQLEKQGDAWQVTVPSYRFDLTIEEDLIEEIVRVYGYDNVPYSKPQTTLEFISQPEQQIPLQQIRNLLTTRGYSEAITYSFIAPKLHNSITPHQTPIILLNPISADLSVMRSSLWSGLLNAVSYNQNRQQTRVRLFETGLRFIQTDNGIQQEAMLAGVIAGDLYPEQWNSTQKTADFFDIKADVENLLALTGQPNTFYFRPGEHTALQPGQTAEVFFQDKSIGFVGALHPTLVHDLNLLGPVYVFELLLANITTATLPKFQALSKFPAMRRDISFWIEAKVPAQDIIQQVKAVAGEWLIDVCLFDVYAEQGSASQQRSLAIGLLWQHPTRTLVEQEVDTLKETVVNQLKNTFSIQLRD